MKKAGHPTWYNDAKVSCVCGGSFTTGSTVPEIRVEVCSDCHPFYTGKQKLLDTKGQVEKFSKSQAVAKAKQEERAKIAANRSAKVQQKQTDKPSLRDLLIQSRKQTS